MAIPAINPQPADVMLVAEWDGLVMGNLLDHFIGRANEEKCEPRH